MSLIARLRRLLDNTTLRHAVHRSKRLIKPVVLMVGMREYHGHQYFQGNRATVVVVSHEASATGAPILALNLCEQLSKHYNVVVMLLRGGALIPNFQDNSIVVLQARMGIVFTALLHRFLRRHIRGSKPRFALVNSVVSAGFIQPLRSLGIPPIALIHEFSAYIRPLDQLNDIGKWSRRVVFSSPLTRDDLLERCPQLQQAAFDVLPQGPCSRPDRPGRQQASVKGSRCAQKFINDLDNSTLLVLGAGEIQPRKGVDLFIAMADQVRKECPDLPIQFAWIGSGYDPVYDFNVSLWLQDQISRSGLNDQMQILDHSPAYGALIKRCNVFCVTSRLDPLPNVAIDALLEGKPMLCFDKACGIAHLLKQNESLGTAWVAPYLNTAVMAKQVSALLQNWQQREILAQLGLTLARSWFDMSSYVEKLRNLGEQAADDEQLHLQEMDRLMMLKAVDSSSKFRALASNLSKGIINGRSAKEYLLSWQSEIWPRKPFAGFHPGIYREQVLADQRQHDPLLHYLEAGKPEGPWSTQLITPNTPTPLPASDSAQRVGLHLHVHYPELLDELLLSIRCNQLRPELLITTSADADASDMEKLVMREGFTLRELVITPNRGRDIGPLITAVGRTLDREYDIHGHLHTKKSAQISGVEANTWRRFLITHMLGKANCPIADRIVATFQSDPDLGMVFPDDPNCVGWTGNEDAATALAQRLSLPTLPRWFDVPVGSMFWARKGALTPLYQLGLTWSDYPLEPIAYNGTLLHAIERLLPLINQAQGFNYAMTHIPGVSR